VDFSALSTKEALVVLEKRLNQVKTLCKPEALRSDAELMVLQSVLRQIALQAGTGAQHPPSLRMLEGLTNGFYLDHVPVAPNVFNHHCKHSIFGRWERLVCQEP
jgi:hypothetical protein